MPSHVHSRNIHALRRRSGARQSSVVPMKCVKAAGYMEAAAAKEKIDALTIAKPCSQSNHVRGEEEERRQAELWRAHDQLQKCLEVADYMGAATTQGKIDALTTAKPCSQPSHVAAKDGRAEADCLAVSAAGHGAATGPIAAARNSGKGAQPNGELFSFESLVEGLAGTCVPVQLEGVTLLSIGKVSDQGKGYGKRGRVRRARKARRARA